MTDNKPTQSDELKADGMPEEIFLSPRDLTGKIYGPLSGSVSSATKYIRADLVDTRASTPPAPQAEGEDVCKCGVQVEPRLSAGLEEVMCDKDTGYYHDCKFTTPQAEGEVICKECCIHEKALEAVTETLKEKLEQWAVEKTNLERRIKERNTALAKYQVALDSAHAEATQLRLSLSKAEEHGRWRGIDTVPRDGNEVEVYSIYGAHVFSRSFLPHEVPAKTLTHWRPKSAPPQPAATPDEIGGG